MVISVRLRKLVHASLALGVLLLPAFTWWQSVSLGGLAVVVCALMLPGLPGHALTRGHDPRLPAAVMFYTLGVLLLVVTFPARPDLVASGWGILAAGDGAATLAGRRWGGWHWPWNRDKTSIGSAAFVVAGTVMGFVLAWALRGFVAPPPSLVFLLVATLAAAVVAAVVETLPIRLDDNLSVAAAATLVLWSATLVSRESSVAAWPLVARTLPIGGLLNTLLAVGVYRAKGVSASGAIAGAIIGTLIFAGAGWSGWLMLILAFGAAWSTSHIGLPRKRVLGIEEAREGRRGAENAIANCGLAAAAALAALFSPYRDAALLALTAALTAAASDTVASEIGKAWGRRTILVTTLSSVPPGTPGAVSIEGTGAGVAAAFLMASIASFVGLIPVDALWVVVASAAVGSIVESALAATLERQHVLDNHLLNFLNTLVAAVCAIWLS
jgi:uncharacterized protein (TIGR00297 family)